MRLERWFGVILFIVMGFIVRSREVIGVGGGVLSRGGTYCCFEKDYCGEWNVEE